MGHANVVVVIMVKIYPIREPKPIVKICECTHSKLDHMSVRLDESFKEACRICECPKFEEMELEYANIEKAKEEAKPRLTTTNTTRQGSKK